jgi:hypothetical protein
MLFRLRVIYLLLDLLIDEVIYLLLDLLIDDDVLVL